MVPLELHPSVFNEIKGAKLWYDEISGGLGDRFLQDLDHGIDCVRGNPDSWPTYICNTRCFFLHRFPFAIVHKYDGTTIKVFAVMHLRRRPDYWLNRFQ